MFYFEFRTSIPMCTECKRCSSQANDVLWGDKHRQENGKNSQWQVLHQIQKCLFQDQEHHSNRNPLRMQREFEEEEDNFIRQNTQISSCSPSWEITLHPLVEGGGGSSSRLSEQIPSAEPWTHPPVCSQLSDWLHKLGAPCQRFVGSSSKLLFGYRMKQLAFWDVRGVQGLRLSTTKMHSRTWKAYL